MLNEFEINCAIGYCNREPHWTNSRRKSLLCGIRHWSLCLC